MHKLQRKNALAALAQDMEEETSERTNVQTLNSPPQEEPKKTKGKSRVVSNVPWYPKSKALKQELKLLALHEESSITALIDEGIKLVLKKRGKDIKDYL